MSMVKLIINGKEVETRAGATVLQAAREADIYIPTLCHHPDLPPGGELQASPWVYQGDLKLYNMFPGETGEGCGLCVVELAGESGLLASCSAKAKDGMVVETNTDRVQDKRRQSLLPILARHRHSCLTCAQQEGCSRTQCSSNVPDSERCCSQFGNCELQNVANYVGIDPATPKWIPTNYPEIRSAPLFDRDYNLCVGCLRCVRACRDLRGVGALGFIYDETRAVRVGMLAPSPAESGCKYCAACVEVCPTGAIVDKIDVQNRKTGDMPPCRAACPAGIDIPEFLRLIARGERAKANAVIREQVPFPGVLGRICVHPCEDACQRGEVDEPISVCALKRFAADGFDFEWREKLTAPKETGKKIAVVGAGPAGLSAAFYLRRMGHQISLFDMEEKPGGMMRYGIPEFRLPLPVLDKEIEEILGLGIVFIPQKRLGKDITLAQLKSEGHDAAFLALGTQLSRAIPLEGCRLPDVLHGVEFLKEINRGKRIALKEQVVVIGGGNVAVDVAMAALRCGAKEVSMAFLETREDMPAGKWEIEGALAEGVKLLPSRGPHKIIRENGRVSGLTTVLCIRVFDSRGNFSPEFDTGARETIPADQVILAVGQTTDFSFLEKGDHCPICVINGLMAVDEETLETGMEGVYAGGDAVQGPGSVVQAIAQGKKAAASIDRALGGNGSFDESLYKRPEINHYLGREEGFTPKKRTRVRETPLSKRRDFTEISLGYSEKEAVAEASRCLQCDLRFFIGRNPSPPKHVFLFNMENVAAVPEAEGVFQLFDEDHKALSIKGVVNLKQELMDTFENGSSAAFFEFEEDKMYSQRESELVQKHLMEYGEMPRGGDDDMDDLF